MALRIRRRRSSPPRPFLFSIHSVTDISLVSESRKRDLRRSLRKKDGQGRVFQVTAELRVSSFKSGHRKNPKFTNRTMELYNHVHAYPFPRAENELPPVRSIRSIQPKPKNAKMAGRGVEKLPVAGRLSLRT